jgi:hypothetical protein
MDRKPEWKAKIPDTTLHEQVCLGSVSDTSDLNKIRNLHGILGRSSTRTFSSGGRALNRGTLKNQGRGRPLLRRLVRPECSPSDAEHVLQLHDAHDGAGTLVDEQSHIVLPTFISRLDPRQEQPLSVLVQFPHS